MKKIYIIVLVLFGLFAHAQTTIQPNSYILNMGITPQTIDNGLKPYGLVMTMLRNEVPVYVVISQSKAKDGIDFTHNNVNYKGGTFIIPGEYITPAIEALITSATWIGVVKTKTTTAFSINVTATLRSAPKFVLDTDNGDKAESYLNNAGINSTAFPGVYSYKGVSSLDACDDVFSMPHADPTFANHGKLYDFVMNKRGALYLACHSVSVFEAITAPANNIYGYPTGTQFNFLSTTGLISRSLKTIQHTVIQYYMLIKV